MRMRQSLAQLEREFEHEAVLDRARREQLRRTATRRTRVRRRERIEKHQQLRFLLLIASITLTVVVVTWAMFQTLAWLMG
jgi:cytochrome c-type biogenesis protein CcmH/NrfG